MTDQGISTLKNSQGAIPGLVMRRSVRLLVTGILIPSVLTAVPLFAVGPLSLLLNLETMVVTSGSMAPAINVGDAVIMERGAVDSIRVGDVITYYGSNEHLSVTHRVVAIEDIDGRTYFQTRGDANATPDPNLSPADAVYGKIIFTLPKAGYLVSFVATPSGLILLIVLPLFLLLVQAVCGLLQAAKSPQLGQGSRKV